MQLGAVSLGNVVPGFPGYDVPESEWNEASRELIGALDGFQHLIARHLAIGASPVLSVVPQSPRARFHPPAVPPGEELWLPDRVIRHEPDADPVIGYEGSLHRVELHGPDAARLLAHLRSRPGAPAPSHAEPLPEPVVRAARAYTAAAGMFTAPDPRPADGR
ncbi:hypothetical protein [Streptomyces sp. RKAG290]|uniref:hypothetical protein n=1 Tax=Streptomyces sp. RKAG290 TaxID=2888348 RepID=UPI0020341A51|nr:hypothetical protein [Streptomyces sp. RKAG290]MCM2414188.1 hypothetical protein [Streptomyces sp. RKAG290]